MSSSRPGSGGENMNDQDPDTLVWANKTDDELVVTNLEQAPKEMMRRLKDSIVNQLEASNRLAKGIFALTFIMAILALIEAIKLFR